MKYLWWSMRVALAVLLLLSGLVKLNDPLGTSYKLQEYFAVFQSDTEWAFTALNPLALPLALLLIFSEIVLAVGLICMGKHARSFVTHAMTALLIFFTALTFYAAFFDKVKECGCFGGAISLTPWQSFGKDIVLLAASLLLLRYRHALESPLKSFDTFWKEMGWPLGILGLSGIIATHVLFHLPWIDFSAYKKGQHLPTLMQPSAPIQYVYVMEKQGKVYQFAQYPSDTSFHFQNMRIANPEAMPKITDYRLWRGDEDVTLDSFEGRKLLLVVSHTRGLGSPTCMTRLTQGILGASKHVSSLWVITSASSETYQSAAAASPALYALPFYFADDALLKTMIRSQIGWILLDEGVVKGKWSGRDTAAMLEEIQKGL